METRVLFPKTAKCSGCNQEKPVCCSDMVKHKCAQCCAHKSNAK